MRRYIIAALTVALVSAPAWARGASVSVRTPVHGVNTIAIGGPHGNSHHHGHQCGYIPGHYESYYQQVWVPGHYKQQHVPPVYKQRRIHGVTVTVMVSNGYHAQVWVPGHYKSAPRQVWRDSYWACGY